VSSSPVRAANARTTSLNRVVCKWPTNGSAFRYVYARFWAGSFLSAALLRGLASARDGCAVFKSGENGLLDSFRIQLR
jgi:hypothetical protein